MIMLHKLLWIALIAAGLLMGSGCAVIDTSNLETANNLRRGKIKVIAYVSQQPTVHPMIYANLLDTSHEIESEKTAPTLGVRLGIGLSDRTEVNIAAATLGGVNFKAAIKRRLSPDNPKVHFAIMPGIRYGSGVDEVSWYDDHSVNYDTAGVEFPLLLTYQFNKYFSTTACLKTSVNHIQFRQAYNNPDAVVEEGTYNSLLSSVSITPRLKVWKFVLMPEVGMCYYTTRYEKNVLLPVYHLGLGFDTGN